jgi:outer membrane receptor for ferrienterochelin and colicin
VFFKLRLLAGVAMAASTGPAFAQTTSAPARPPATVSTSEGKTPPAAPTPPADAATRVDEVVVQGRATDVRTSIDATSYSLADDLQAATGVLADVLRNVPSVEVGPDGEISIRGDVNVVILVDGQPSSQFNGPGRGQMLLQVPANQYARVEVMTNPSAAYSPEGSAVINLISKPNAVRPGATTTGSMRANLGSSGAHNLGVNLSHVLGRTTLAANVTFRHDVSTPVTERTRQRQDAVPGQAVQSSEIQSGELLSDVLNLRLTADHKLNDQTQLFGEARYYGLWGVSDGFDVFEASRVPDGARSAFRRVLTGDSDLRFGGATARVLRRFGGEGHEWTNEIRIDSNKARFQADTVEDQQLPVAPTTFETNIVDNLREILGLTSAYVRPLADGGRLRMGYELQATSLKLRNNVSRGLAPEVLTPDPALTNTFEALQAVHALYATWERPMGDKLSAQLGLRLEQTELDLDQVTTNIQSSNARFDAYPTAHISWTIGEGESLRASFSRRIQRPDPYVLNPFLTQLDSLTFSAGNPDLLPQATDAFEVMWQKRVQQTFYQATLYYRDTTDAFTPVTRDFGGGVFVTRTENLGASTSSGMELVANGALLPTLRYNASLNAYRQEIDASRIIGGVSKKGEGVSARLTLNWEATPSDFLQVSGIWTGDQLQAQGVREQSPLFNLGYRRKLSREWSLQATVRDIFDDYRQTVAIETPILRDRTQSRTASRTFFIGLTWTFGSGQQRAPDQFDFSTSAGGG